MKKLLFLILFFYAAIVSAQKTNVVVEGITPNLYLTHIVSPKENFYSIGRMYNQAPNAIASFNNTKLERGLAIGQTLKIPLNATNFDVSKSANSGEALVPVYHIVTLNETLFRIGNNHAAPLDNIKQWNNLSSDNIEIGTPLIVGYLKVKNENLAAFNAIDAKAVQIKIVNSAVAPVKTESTVAKPATEAIEETQPIANEEAQPVAVKEVKEEVPTAAKSEAPIAAVDAPKQSEVVATPATPAAPKAEVASANDITERKPEPAITEKPVAPQPASNVSSINTAVSNNESSVSSTSMEEGSFAPLFVVDAERSLMNKAGEAGTFKSTSGWQDKKYYVLMNDVTPGTIVKLSASNNNVVYAKVLGAMPDTKDSGSLLLRMSSAAASTLGIIDPKFPVQVTYYQ